MVEPGEIRVVRSGGSKINFRKPVFTLDSKFLLCSSGDSVKVYSSATEECVRILHGHSDLVTGIALNPSNHLQVYSCSVDGTVKLWDFTDGILIKTFVIGYKLLALYVSPDHEGTVFLIIPMESNKESEAFQLVSVQLPKVSDQEVEARDVSILLSNVNPAPKATSFGRGGTYIASVKGLHMSVYFFKKQKTYRLALKATDKKGAKNMFTCVTCHPKEDCIATGHEDGKIRLWRNFNQKKEYTYSTQHWHHNIVKDLSFTPAGTNMLSGGIESVLVQWRYGEETRKDFLPRLGAAIEYVCASPDGVLYCTSHSDNKITIIQSNLKVIGVIQGLVKGDNIKTNLMIDPRSKALVLNGKPGHLLFYSLQHDKQLYNLDIVQQEYIHESGLQQFEVVKAAFDAQGSWLATVEERKNKLSEWEVILKMWGYDEQTQSFVLNTTVTSPHEGQITVLCFCNANETSMLVTAGKDGQFKAWLLGENSDQETCWTCDFVGSYHNLSVTNSCFSADGSLLAVSFQEIVTIWNPDSWDLLCTFCQPPGKIRKLCFGRLSCSKYLLGTTTNNLLCCWNLLTCKLEWSADLNVICLEADPLSENIAAFSFASGSSDLFVFKPSEPRPLYVHKAVCLGQVQRAVFAPREAAEDNCSESSQWLNRSRLYFLSEHMDLMTFVTKSEEDWIVASNKQLSIDESTPVTPFSLLLGRHRQQHQTDLDKQKDQLAARVQNPQGTVAVKELLQTPAYVLPSASFLCTMFVNSLLICKHGNGEVSEEIDEDMDSDKEEDDDSEKEMDSLDNLQEFKTEYLLEEQAPELSRSEEKELKKLRKTDYSWLSKLRDY
ncbi:WD repeat-containing protein 75 [Lepisosteus oculatus]|uniref:WD repeat-containing protein 75 n=1 Tax=Lepisosteus oculatus TaxID=7918 RepID=UPI0035F50C96